MNIQWSYENALRNQQVHQEADHDMPEMQAKYLPETQHRKILLRLRAAQVHVLKKFISLF